MIGTRAGKAEFRRRFATFLLSALPESHICLLLITRSEYIDKVPEKSSPYIQENTEIYIKILPENT